MNMKYNGWIVRMKEYMKESAKSDLGIQEYMKVVKDGIEHKNFVAYGEFNRMQFTPVQCWNEYHEGFLFSDWIRQQQTVMLFNFSDGNNLKDGLQV